MGSEGCGWVAFALRVQSMELVISSIYLNDEGAHGETNAAILRALKGFELGCAVAIGWNENPSQLSSTARCCGGT